MRDHSSEKDFKAFNSENRFFFINFCLVKLFLGTIKESWGFNISINKKLPTIYRTDIKSVSMAKIFKWEVRPRNLCKSKNKLIGIWESLKVEESFNH